MACGDACGDTESPQKVLLQDRAAERSCEFWIFFARFLASLCFVRVLRAVRLRVARWFVVYVSVDHKIALAHNEGIKRFLGIPDPRAPATRTAVSAHRDGSEALLVVACSTAFNLQSHIPSRVFFSISAI